MTQPHDSKELSEELAEIEREARAIPFEQRVLLFTWFLGLVLVPCKLVGWTPALSWGEVTFPLWGGTIFFLAWGLLAKAVSRG